MVGLLVMGLTTRLALNKRPTATAQSDSTWSGTVGPGPVYKGRAGISFPVASYSPLIIHCTAPLIGSSPHNARLLPRSNPVYITATTLSSVHNNHGSPRTIPSCYAHQLEPNVQRRETIEVVQWQW